VDEDIPAPIMWLDETAAPIAVETLNDPQLEISRLGQLCHSPENWKLSTMSYSGFPAVPRP
jgi:hypothetical protein